MRKATPSVKSMERVYILVTDQYTPYFPLGLININFCNPSRTCHRLNKLAVLVTVISKMVGDAQEKNEEDKDLELDLMAEQELLRLTRQFRVSYHLT